ncbi:hypothetical protein FHS86_000752 [Roseimarinus sediminis]|jgi:hypothetical protein
MTTLIWKKLTAFVLPLPVYYFQKGIQTTSIIKDNGAGMNKTSHVKYYLI